ncbi:MAG: class I SAM-dependent methyltransferase [Cyclobacteriaceae bacterium]
MDPNAIGKKYDNIAGWWNDQHVESSYGLPAFERALQFNNQIESALDVGCGSGGRFIKKLSSLGCSVTGIDVSEGMIDLAKSNHPQHKFVLDDICKAQINDKFDLVYAWDSIFHLPLKKHKPVISKLCKALRPQGIILYTFGNDIGEHMDTWKNDTFYYSSIGINENIALLIESGIKVLHLEIDQYPEKHVVVIGQLQ